MGRTRRRQLNSSYDRDEYAAIEREARSLGMSASAWQRLVALDAAGIEDASLGAVVAKPLTAREAANDRFLAGELESLAAQLRQRADSRERVVPEPVELAAEVFGAESVLEDDANEVARDA